MPSSRRPFGAAAVFWAWEPVCGRAGDERGRDVFCKNCPFPSRALPNPEKTFVRVRPSVPVVVRLLLAIVRDREGGGRRKGPFFPGAGKGGWLPWRGVKTRKDGRGNTCRWRPYRNVAGRVRFPVYGSAVIYRYEPSCRLSVRGMTLFPSSDGDFPYRSEKKFLEGEGDARERGGPFSKKVFPPPACPASFRNTCYFLFENIS